MKKSLQSRSLGERGEKRTRKRIKTTKKKERMKRERESEKVRSLPRTQSKAMKRGVAIQ